MVDGESLEEVGYDRLLEGLATLFPSSVGETMSTIGVYQDAAFATADERQVRSDVKLREHDWQTYTSSPTSLLLSSYFFLHALALSWPYAFAQYSARSWGWSTLTDGWRT